MLLSAMDVSRVARAGSRLRNGRVLHGRHRMSAYEIRSFVRRTPCQSAGKFCARLSATAAAEDAVPGTAEAFPAPEGVCTVVLKRGKARLFRHGQPLVYNGAIDSVQGTPAPGLGDIVMVADGAKNTLGWGVFNPNSMFRVRILQLLQDMQNHPGLVLDVAKLLQHRIAAAVELRRALGLPRSDLDVYRLVNSEGDRLSGLVADALGPVIVVSSSAAWVERYRPQVEEALRDGTGLQQIIWRQQQSMLKEEGWPEAAEQPAEAQDMVVEVQEHGIRFRASPFGQKTGFYADQRPNRELVRSCASGKRVLDLCCYSGAFALAAVAGGATHVTGVDSSAAALELASENAAFNNCSEKCDWQQRDISEFMSDAIARGETWDMVVLDPPKLAPSRKTLSKAASKYRKLNRMAIQLVRPGGLLMTCSCSGAMTQSGDFLGLVKAAAHAVGRHATVLHHGGASTDHTLDPSYPEGRYLTALLVGLA